MRESRIIVLLNENSHSCAGKRPYNNMLWFCPREFTTLKGIKCKYSSHEGTKHVLSAVEGTPNLQHENLVTLCLRGMDLKMEFSSWNASKKRIYRAATAHIRAVPEKEYAVSA